ncbi:MAG TPA: signal peptidase II [Acidimicrobiales bacterium]|nr:signal peptidase II [Acidimicrobiales bacterium]
MIAVVAALVVIADQVSKSLEQTSLASGPVHVLGPLDLELSYNRGAAFGIGSGVTPVILVVGAVLIVLVMGFGRPVRNRLATVASGLLAGGAVSNLGDRLFRPNGGAVIDWIHLSHWPTFNVADSCIVVGVAMLVIANWGSRPA